MKRHGFHIESPGTQPSGGKRRMQLLLALADFLQSTAGIVLTAPSPRRGAHHARQRGGMKRALQETDIAEDGREPQRGGIPFRAAAALSQQYDGYVRPGGLRLEKVDERPQLRFLQGFVGDDRQSRALVKFLIQNSKMRADVCREARLLQQHNEQRRVASARRENERAQRQGSVGVHESLADSKGLPSPA